MLVGYSMGAAVALNVATDTAVDGLVLLAPFWKIGTGWQKVVWQVLKRLFPQLQPFKKADFNDPRLGEFFRKTIPDLDIMEPEVQKIVRDLRVPARFVDQVLALGQSAGHVAADIQVPVHIVQGTDDETVTTQRTRELLQRLAGPVSYRELATDHQLVSADSPSFWQMSRSVLTYARSLSLVGKQQLSGISGVNNILL
jgi:alpha-beta hydrolase superfamily lysophospholipase